MGVYLVTTMEEVTALASANPYAAIVIDANAEGLFDEELLVDLARTQHIILIRGFNAAAVSSYEEYASALKIERTSIHSQVFFSCIVDAVDRSIHAYNYLTQDNISMDDIFEFAEETKMMSSISMMRLLFSTTLNSFLKLKMQIFLPLIWFRKHFRLNSRMRLQHLMIGIRPQTIV